MKVGIVTWITYRNFGTALQAYALSHVLSELGYQPFFIDDAHIVSQVCPPPVRHVVPDKLLNPLRWPEALRRFLILRKRCYIDGMKSVTESYSRFYAGHINVSDRKEARVFVCGSDQIWSSPGAENLSISRHYFLQGFEGKKISYAPSINIAEDFLADYKSMVKPWLDDFTAISSREKHGCSLLRTITGREIAHVLDPTLLLSARSWEELCPTGHDHGKYCLCYFLNHSEDYIRLAKQYARSHGLELKYIVLDTHQYVSPEISVFCGPTEFLSLVRDASMVFTDSFHGTIFSLIFGRPFMSFRRFWGEHSKQNLRITELLEAFGLQHRYVDAESYSAEVADDPIDFMEVERILSSAKTESLTYLKEALEDETR